MTAASGKATAVVAAQRSARGTEPMWQSSAEGLWSTPGLLALRRGSNTPALGAFDSMWAVKPACEVQPSVCMGSAAKE